MAAAMYRDMGMTYWLEKAEAEMRGSVSKSVHLLYRLSQLWVFVALTLVAITAPASADNQVAFRNADIQTVIGEVAKLTETTFLFDPTRVKGNHGARRG
jgi:type II secretory pathway component GspD/PulD (secretin)